MDIISILIILIGSAFGLILRIYIQNNFKINIGFNIQNISIINFISSFFLGIFVAFNFINNDILMGDKVAPRREFIETHSSNLDLATLDI